MHKEVFMSNWGDENDDELQNRQRKEYGVLISFKSMINAINSISEETGDYDENYPKKSLDNIWFGDVLMLGFFILFTYNIVAIATIPFIGLYFYVLIKLSTVYGQFKYSKGSFWLKTIIALALVTAITTLLKIYILG